MKIYFAPLQGYTDAAYRRFHNEIFGGCISAYYAPFMRVEHGAPRAKDLKDIAPANNLGVELVPQIIVKDTSELNVLVPSIISQGYNHIDINMGCPFPLQVKKGRGAGLLSNPNAVKLILGDLVRYKDVSFSVKMRLGNDDVDQWKDIAPILNDAQLSHITIHPRIAIQQYKGMVLMDSFYEFYHQIKHPIIFNGDIIHPSQIEYLVTEYPRLKGVMIGRGLLTNPALAMEYLENVQLDLEQRISKILEIHNKLFAYYASKLQGDSHLLTKMKTFWDYSEPIIGHKTYKLIHKASSLSKYKEVITQIAYLK